MNQLYRKTISKAGKVSYQAIEPEPETYITLTDAQCLTAAGALGTTLLMMYERLNPPHKKVARKIKAVEVAILDLYQGTGEPLDRDIAEIMCAAWDKAMMLVSAERGERGEDAAN